ncbi:mechanosensitive ion channel family protein [Pigmentiphaga aceris]|nr:mechanosensitive ion channel family protein [Pigmentiphaga aceris]
MLDEFFQGFSMRALLLSLRAGFTQLSFLGHLALTVFVLITAMIVSRLISRYYRKPGTGTTEAKRMAYLVARNTLGGVTAVLLLFIWAGELRTFALSIAALAAAVAIVCKEFFMNGLGSLMRAVARPYSIGDVIELGAMKGEVLEIDFLSTRLLEQGPSGYVTGRTYEFPNMMVLLNPIRKLSHTGRFVHELVRVPMDPAGNVARAERLLREAGETVCADWIEAADAHFRRLESSHLIALPESRPLAMIEPVDPKRVDILLRFPCQSNRRLATSQAILHAYYVLAKEPDPDELPDEQDTPSAEVPAPAAAPESMAAPIGKII